MTKYEFGYDFQEEVLWSMLCAPDFLKMSRGAIESEHFTDIIHEVVADEILIYFDSRGSPPTRTALLEELREQIKKGAKFKLSDFRKELIKITNLKKVNAEYVASKVREFAAVSKGTALCASFEEYVAKDKIDEWNKEVENALALRHPEPSFTPIDEGVVNRFKSYKGGYKKHKPVPTGLAKSDELLCGGPGAGELAIMMGITGSGKSHLMTCFGANAAIQGMRVYHVSCELTLGDLLLRYDQRITGKTAADIAKKASPLSKMLKKKQLYLAHYPSKKLKPSELRSAIHKMGPPDLLIVDYPALLWSDGNIDSRFSIEMNYLEMRNLAAEFNCGVWAPFQCNRLAHEIQKSNSEGNHITIEQAAEAYGVNRHSDITGSWNNTLEELENNEGRLWWDKIRSGNKDKVSIKCKFDWDISRVWEMEV